MSVWGTCAGWGLRPAVIARKASHCSKSINGANAFAAFASVVQTLAQRGEQHTVEGLSHLFQSAQLQRDPP